MAVRNQKKQGATTRKGRSATAAKSRKLQTRDEKGGGEKKAPTWVAPKGYAICPESSCDRPVRNGATTGGETIWQCKPSEACSGERCGCYLCIIAPGETHLRIEAKPGERGSGRRMAPGWAMVCVCMKETGEAKESGWGDREDVGWIAPKGYKFAAHCPGHCQYPHWDSSKEGSWVCGSRDQGSEHDCFLVGAAPGDKQLHFLARPGSTYSAVDVPPGWAIFCICLEAT
jgi:hypothetical protein